MSMTRCVFFVAAVAISGGCSSDPPSAEVSGNVTYDGKPIETGTISFFPRDGKGATSGGVIIDGAYTAKNVPFGEMDVKFHGSKIIGKRKLYPNDPKSAEVPIVAPLIPERYHEKTTITLDVKERVIKKDFDLKK